MSVIIRKIKRVLISFALLFSINAICYGQSLENRSEIKGRSEVFTISKGTSGNLLIVMNKKNSLGKTKPKTSPSNISYVKLIDKNAFLNSFKKVFDKKRTQQLLQEKYVAMMLYVNPTGKVLEVIFYFKPESLITANEIELLEDKIKRDVHYKLLPQETKGGDYFPVGNIVKFSQLLDGTKY